MNKVDIDGIVEFQRELTVKWHGEEPSVQAEGLLGLVEGNHMKNFCLWHREDEARRDDMGFEYVYDAKRAIDGFNQKRNDFMEKMDRFMVGEYGEPKEGVVMHTETPGMIIDRMSILALKEYHMAEEVERDDVDEAHKEKCGFKLKVIRKQLSDLKEGLKAFLAEVKAGTRGFRVYYQFKMYNDSSLNPQLYKKQEETLGGA